MSIKIHHGPNGSYKTSGAIQDDCIPALKEGRLIITNIRGFTLERVYKVFPKLPIATEIINLSLESLADLERMRTWFMWAPKGAFIIFDETQILFPKSWRDSDLKRFDFPGGPEAAAEADRPMGWLDAWTRHRHWNWDIVLTTPNISYIREDIRMTSEMAYKHSNLAVIGVPGRYKEAQHDAQINRPPLEGTIIEYKKIDKKTFEIYQSTATGIAHDTKAGKSLFRSPKLLLLLAFIAACLLFSLSMGPVTFVVSETAEPVASPAEAIPASRVVAAATPDAVAASADNRPSGGVSGQPLSVRPGASVADLIHPFADRRISIVGYAFFPSKGSIYLFSFEDAEGRRLRLNSHQLVPSGYSVAFRGECLAELRWETWKQLVTCSGSALAPAGMERQGMQAGAKAPASSLPATGVQVTHIPDNSRMPRTLN